MVKISRIHASETRSFRPTHALVLCAVVVGLVMSLTLGDLVLPVGSSPATPMEGVPPTMPSPRTAGPSEPIVISGNAQLAAFCSGNASMDGLSWNTAYRLENYTINCGGSGSGIAIFDTNAFLLIQNCSVTNPSNTWGTGGFYLENVTHAKVANCTSSGGYAGVFVYQSIFNYVEQNNLTNSDFGIFIQQDSNYNTIQNNKIFDGSKPNSYNSAGIHVDFGGSGICLRNWITSNTIFTYPIGISLGYGANYTQVVENNASNNNLIGIRVSGDCEYITLKWNIVLENAITGINLSHSISGSSYPKNTYVYHNWVIENGIYGDLNEQIFIHGAVDTVTDRNVLDWNTDSDGDGIPDYFELALGKSNPDLADTDWDNYLDGYEIMYGSDPNNQTDYPPLQHEDFLRLLGYCEDNATLLNQLMTDVQENASLLQTLFTFCDNNATILTGLIADVQGNTNLLQALFSYCDNNATILGGVISDLDGNATLLQAVDALATQNGQKLETLNITHIADIAALQLVVNKLGVSLGDTDYDGLDDLAELQHGTSVTQGDSDGDGYLDGYEVSQGMDPLTPDQTHQYSFMVGIGAAGIAVGALVIALVGVVKKRQRT